MVRMKIISMIKTFLILKDVRNDKNISSVTNAYVCVECICKNNG